LGGDGFWEGDYGWGVRVRRHFGARGMSSVRYGTRLGDLKNKQSTHTHYGGAACYSTFSGSRRQVRFSCETHLNSELN